MKTGVCIAGVRADEPSIWVRPVREFGTVLLGDITYPGSGSSPGATRRVMRPFDLVEFQFDRHRPDPPHVEDYSCDFSRNHPRLVGVVPEESRAALLAASATAPAAIWDEATRSLGSLAVEQFTATFTADAYTGAYEARLSFLGMPAGASSVACTDLKWRALGRSLFSNAAHTGDMTTLTLTSEQLNEALGGPRAWWLALGVTRTYRGRPWPLVVGAHALPEYEATVDYSAL
jgi:hypothetical protein